MFRTPVGRRFRHAWTPRPLRLAALFGVLYGATACAGDATRARVTTGQGEAAVALAAADRAIVDDFGDTLVFTTPAPARVVSLSPAVTEIVFAIGQGHRLVGRTSWDDRPAAVRQLPDVGAGIRPNVEAVLATRPALVLLYASPENRAAREALTRAGVRVIALRTVTIADFRRSAAIVGRALDGEREAGALVDSIDATLAAVRDAVRDVERPRVVWPSWESPVMVVADDSYEAELLDIAGARNVFADREEPVATVTIEEIAARDPDLVLAGPERVARLRASTPWRAVRAVRDGRLVVLDTAVIGRPGVAIGMSAVALARALHPDRAARLP